MKFAWKLIITQICIAVCLALASWLVIRDSLGTMQMRYLRNTIEGHFTHIINDMEASAQEALNQASVFARLPLVIQAYEIALGGDINDSHSPQSQAAREMLRELFVPVLESHEKATGQKLRLHFHLPNGFSLVRLWRDKQKMSGGKWVDVSDNIGSYRFMVRDVNATGKMIMGLEPGSDGFSIRGMLPVTAPDGRQLGSVEIQRDFESILAAASEPGKTHTALYAGREFLEAAAPLRDTPRYASVGDFIRITSPARDGAVESLITPELLDMGIRDGAAFEYSGSTAVAVRAIADYRGKQAGVLACVMDAGSISEFTDTTKINMMIMMACLVVAPFMVLLLAAHGKLEAMVRWYQSVLDAIPFLVAVQDVDMKWLFINKAVEDLIGKKRKDAVGMPCNTWGTDICGTDKCVVACAKQGMREVHFSYNDLSYKADVEMLRGARGETIGYIELIQDITELQRMAKLHAEAKAASQAKSAFLSTMSHEIRTPMNAILGITEMQMQKAALSADIREAFDRIYAASHTLLSIINDILDLSRIEAGKMELLPVKYKLADMIHDTAQLNMMRIGSKPIAFSIQVDADTPLELFGDELRIKQILNNLLSNAFKYTQAGEVKLAVDAEYKNTGAEVTLVFRVSDTGQGMTETQIDRLFDEYSRFYMEANRMIEGTGLGMNIAQHLVNMMGGEIFVTSELHRGTIFTVRLPQLQEGSGKLGAGTAVNLQKCEFGVSQRKVIPLTREPMPYGRVLVVDDLETNLYVAKGLMSPYGLLVDTALSGFEAIEKIRDGNEYDVVFVDHMMPKMDGVETVRILRELGYGRSIVALTANALVGQAEMFLGKGFDAFLPKPIDLRHLDLLLNKLVRDAHAPEVVEAARRQRSFSHGGMPHAAVDSQLAGIFALDAAKAITTLEAIHANSCRRDDDMSMFVVNAHAMKSALANVGAPELSAVAGDLEEAGRQGNTDIILAGTPAFLDALRAFVKKIAPEASPGGCDGDGAGYSEPSYLREQLQAVQAACAAYDKKTARIILADIRQKNWPFDTRRQLDAIAERLLHSEFEEVSSLVQKFCL